jgi:L-ascorbate metabolism protein UlaG (beta-lactamase superfamily)
LRHSGLPAELENGLAGSEFVEESKIFHKPPGIRRPQLPAEGLSCFIPHVRMRGFDMKRAVLGWALAALAAAFSSATANAATDACPGLIAGHRPLIVPAALGHEEVKITFVGHATFLIESPGGIRVATDYNDYVRPQVTPDVATMNKAHSTHYTYRPDPGIHHVLRGWNPAGGPARHDVQVGDVRVRNVVTNIRDWAGGTEYDGNSIFVFETADLCVAHLGHLHHTLTPEHLKQIGRIDVVLVPVDGSYTLDVTGMIEVLKSLNAPLMLPMHYFGETTLHRFLDQVRQHWPVAFHDTSSLVVSRAILPQAPKFLVLPGR